MQIAVKSMKPINSVLREQLEKFNVDISAIPGNIGQLLNEVSSTYEKLHADESSVGGRNEQQLFFDKIPEVLFSIDVENCKCLFVNPACSIVYGYSQADFTANCNLWTQVVVREDQPLIQKTLADLHAGNSAEQEYRIRHKNGEVRWMCTKLEPTLNAAGKLARLDGFTSDISRRKEAEIALKESEYMFRSLIENNSDAITLVNDKLEVVYASDSMLKVTGFSPNEVLGKTYSYFVHPEDADRVRQFFTDVYENPGEPQQIVYRTRRKDDVYIWCDRRTINLLHDPVIKGIISNYRDITELQNQLEALENANDRLKKTNLELDKFVYSVSHDLRAPLASVLGVIGLMEGESYDESVMFSLGLIKESVQKLDRFILNILDYSRNSRLDVKRDEIDMELELQGITDNLKFIVHDNANYKISSEITAGGYPFFTDRNRLYSILNNLVANALRYADHTKPEPYVFTHVDVAETVATITVKDNGIGIPAEKHQKVFEMFYRLSNKSVGSLLGLYLVSEAIGKLKGTIDLKSAPGEGTEITLVIPNMLNT
jgi:PAS domain S-box-containing protein